MTQGFCIRTDLYLRLKALKEKDNVSFSKVIDDLFRNIDEVHKEYQKLSNDLQEAAVNDEGRFPGSKALAGKTILYKVREEPEHA